jgi:hypothetical protein
LVWASLFVLFDKQIIMPIKHLLQPQDKLNSNDCLTRNCWIE